MLYQFVYEIKMQMKKERWDNVYNSEFDSGIWLKDI